MKKKKKHPFLILIIILFSISALISGYRILWVLSQYKQGQDTYTSLSEQFSVKEETPAIPASQKTSVVNPDMPEEEETITKLQEKSMKNPAPDFYALQTQVNSEIVAWIYCADTSPSLDYPVVYRPDDNQFYLERDVYRRDTGYGTLFIGPLYQPDFSCDNTVIYGHHMNDGSMFGRLGSWENQEWFDTHRYFYIHTPTDIYKVEMIAYVITPDQSEMYQANFYDSASKEAYVQQALSQSTVTCDYQYNENDRFVTLSTCMYQFQNARGILIGHLIPITG